MVCSNEEKLPKRRQANLNCLHLPRGETKTRLVCVRFLPLPEHSINTPEVPVSVFFCKMKWEIREIFLSKSKENSFSSFHRQICGPVVVCSTSDWTQGIIHARVDFLSQLWNYFEMKHNLLCWCTSQRILLQRREVPKFWQVLPFHRVLLACLHALANQLLNTTL